MIDECTVKRNKAEPLGGYPQGERDRSFKSFSSLCKEGLANEISQVLQLKILGVSTPCLFQPSQSGWEDQSLEEV